MDKLPKYGPDQELLDTLDHFERETWEAKRICVRRFYPALFDKKTGEILPEHLEEHGRIMRNPNALLDMRERAEERDGLARVRREIRGEVTP